MVEIFVVHIYFEFFSLVVLMLFRVFDARLFYEMVEGLYVAISLILGRFMMSTQRILLGADFAFIVYALNSLTLVLSYALKTPCTSQWGLEGLEVFWQKCEIC